MPEEKEPPSSGTVGVERGVVNPQSRSCRGCLFYSSFLRDSNQNPTCYGFSRSIPHSYRTLEERVATKDFKYACVGYGVHKELAPSPNCKPPEDPWSAPSEEFTSRFCRSARIVATSVVNHAIRIAGAARATVNDLFSSNDRKSK